jgi:hypothetical protein
MPFAAHCFRWRVPSRCLGKCLSGQVLSLLAATPGFAASGPSAEMDPAKLPPAAKVQVDFDRDIKPILENRCYRCHGPERPKSRFRLDNREGALKGGEHGVDIVPGQSAKSPLIYYVARVVEDMEMPPSGKGDPLTPEQVGLFRAWVDQGAKWAEGATAKAKTLFSVEPSFAWIGVSGDKQQFREQWGMKDGWSGGIRDFQLHDRTPDGVKLDVEGRALANQDDYRVKANLEKADLGFVHFGYEQYRKYFDDTGGFYAPYATNAVSLDNNLYLDIGRAWFDVGLTLPDWPRIVIGYEYQFKEGNKSSLSWSDVSPATTTTGLNAVSIYPNYKDLEEKTHIVKFDISHEISGVRLEDSFRAEFYDLNSDRFEYFPTSVGSSPSGLTQYHEDYSHFQAVNTFRVEKQFKDWLLLGGGYLYSKLEGDSGISVEAFQLPTGVPLLPLLDAGNPIIINRESHIWNLSSLWGPWDGLTLSAGLQNEWTHENGFGQGLLQVLSAGQPPVQHVYASDRDKVFLGEDLSLRYTKIPFTVLFAETRFRQEWIDLSARDQNSLEGADFLQGTDARNNVTDIRTGFTISPWTRVSLDASYRHTLDTTDYNNRVDTSPVLLDPALGILSGNGYPAFFRRRDMESDEVEVRLVLHPASWIKTTLKYQLQSTDYRTVTDSSTLLGLNTVLPGGEIFAGNYDANIYSFNATLSPWRRLNFSTTFSFNNARTVTGVNGQAGVVPYQGDIYSVLSTANFVVSKSTDFNLSYTFSRANYQQDNQDQSLPLGIDYTRHGLVTGFSHRFGKKITANLQYGFFYYTDPASGGATDYTAHAVFGSLKMVFD